jgi:hypothetical protein
MLSYSALSIGLWIEALKTAIHILRGCLFPVFHHFFICSQEIKKLDAPKSEKLEAPFHELLAFGAIQLLDLLKANLQK